jgi:hypothetical protein
VRAPGADDASLGVVCVEVDRASLQPGDDTGCLLWDWVIHGAGISAPRCATLGDATPALGP